MTSLPLLALFLLFNMQQSKNSASSTRSMISATLTVVGLDEDGVMPLTSLQIPENTTLLQASVDAFQKQGIPFDVKGSGEDLYLTSLAGLAQFDLGPGSGWLYQVNGIFPPLYPNQYIVKPGDKIVWLYTADGGHDRQIRLSQNERFNNFVPYPLSDI